MVLDEHPRLVSTYSMSALWIRLNRQSSYHPIANSAQWNPQKKKWKANFFGIKKREIALEPSGAPILAVVQMCVASCTFSTGSLQVELVSKCLGIKTAIKERKRTESRLKERNPVKFQPGQPDTK